MAIDKAIDSAQLDADLTAVANAVRTKGGTSASLAFPAGFVSAIGSLAGEGSYDILSASGSYVPASDETQITIGGLPFKPNAFLVWHEPNGVPSVSLGGKFGRFWFNGRTNSTGVNNEVNGYHFDGAPDSYLDLNDLSAAGFSNFGSVSSDGFTLKKYGGTNVYNFIAGQTYSWKAWRIVNV